MRAGFTAFLFWGFLSGNQHRRLFVAYESKSLSRAGCTSFVSCPAVSTGTGLAALLAGLTAFLFWGYCFIMVWRLTPRQPSPGENLGAGLAAAPMVKLRIPSTRADRLPSA